MYKSVCLYISLELLMVIKKYFKLRSLHKDFTELFNPAAIFKQTKKANESAGHKIESFIINHGQIVFDCNVTKYRLTHK